MRAKGFFAIALAALAVAACYYAQKALTTEASEARAAAPIVINEVVSAGKVDYVEIYNPSDETIPLDGWTLVEDGDYAKTYTFKNASIAPGGYYIVYCDKLDAPFKLSASGESLVLADALGAVADSLEAPSLSAGESYSRVDGEWAIVGYQTPGVENDFAAAALLLEAGRAEWDAIELTEVMAQNATYAIDGVCRDYVELHNRSDAPVNLTGYFLTDSISQPMKYALPDVTLSPDEYYTVSLGAGGLFALSASGEVAALYNPAGELADIAEWEELDADEALSKSNGAWTILLAPTPGMANTRESAALLDAAFRAARSTGLYISEVMAAPLEGLTATAAFDWIELHNATNASIDLSGYGLSDDASSPRKWQFPNGAKIGAGERLVVLASGYSYSSADRYGYYHANFRVSSEGGRLMLSLPSGEIIDRVPLGEQYGGVSYARAEGVDGFHYFKTATPGAANAGEYLERRAQSVTFSTSGGIYSRELSLSLSAGELATIYYTLDSSAPDTSSLIYTGPLSITSTTVVRAIAVERGALDSAIVSNTYLYGVSHTERVVALVADPDDLFSHERGILALGDGDDSELHYGANFYNDWEREAGVQIFEIDGTLLISQECGVKVNGATSRALDQKPLALTARSAYGADCFRAALFGEREASEYKGFALRAAGQDYEFSFMRDSVLTALAKDTSLMYYESEICALYLNGEYYGQYYMRERGTARAIAAFEGWKDSRSISIVTSYDLTWQGSNATYAALMEWIATRDGASDEDIAHVETIVDLDNYLEFVGMLCYSANQDIGIKRYMSYEGDGRWKWVLFDLDLAFMTDTDSVRRWLNPEGAGAGNETDNRLFVYVMQNANVRDRFLSRLGELIQGPLSSANVAVKFEARYQALLPEMEKHFQRWTTITFEQWQSRVQTLIDYSRERPAKLVAYIRDYFALTDEQLSYYFGSAFA